MLFENRITCNSNKDRFRLTSGLSHDVKSYVNSSEERGRVAVELASVKYHWSRGLGHVRVGVVNRLRQILGGCNKRAVSSRHKTVLGKWQEELHALGVINPLYTL